MSARVERSLAGKNLDVGNQRVGVLWGWHALREPSSNHLVFRRADIEAPPAAVWNRERWFQQHQASGRFDWIGTPAKRLVSERVIVRTRIVAAQRELEAILPRSRAMAWTRVASHFRH